MWIGACTRSPCQLCAFDVSLQSFAPDSTSEWIENTPNYQLRARKCVPCGKKRSQLIDNQPDRTTQCHESAWTQPRIQRNCSMHSARIVRRYWRKGLWAGCHSEARGYECASDCGQPVNWNNQFYIKLNDCVRQFINTNCLLLHLIAGQRKVYLDIIKMIEIKLCISKQ